jgi:SAM-dependent methyltransferase
LLAEFLCESGVIASRGSALDIGCGNGAFLRAFHEAFPHWQIVGAEINETFRQEITNIASGARFFGLNELEADEGPFQLVSLIHCLEHIPSPVTYLSEAKRHLNSASILLIQVPDAEVNPFDLIIADHASHFSKDSLRRVVEEAGFEVVHFGNLILGKEITAIVRIPRSPVKTTLSPDVDFAGRHLAWIDGLLVQAKALADRGPIGIFGSSIAGTWLGSQLGSRLAFFVDEDDDRVGRTNLGVPILHPSEVSNDTEVLLALEPILARSVGSRLVGAGLNVVFPTPVY